MKIIFAFLVVSAIFLTGCNDKETLNNLNSRITNLENRKISSDTAILIAKGQMSEIKMKDYEISVKETIDSWEVHFKAKCISCTDGEPYVVINKMTGEIVREYPFGEPYP